MVGQRKGNLNPFGQRTTRCDLRGGDLPSTCSIDLKIQSVLHQQFINPTKKNQPTSKSATCRIPFLAIPRCSKLNPTALGLCNSSLRPFDPCGRGGATDPMTSGWTSNSKLLRTSEWSCDVPLPSLKIRRYSMQPTISSRSGRDRGQWSEKVGQRSTQNAVQSIGNVRTGGDFFSTVAMGTALRLELYRKAIGSHFVVVRNYEG